MALGKSFLLLGLGALTRSAAILRQGAKAKTFLILMLTAFFIVVCAPGAFAFQGQVSGIFTNPQPADPDHPEEMRVWEQPDPNYFVYGGSHPQADNNSLLFDGEDNFDTTFNQPFALGQFEYHNTTTPMGRSPVAVDLVVELAFTDPAGIEQNFTYSLDLLTTLNDGDTPEENADSVAFPFDTPPTETYELNGVEFTLKLIALENLSGDGFIDPENPNHLSAYEEGERIPDTRPREEYSGDVSATLVAMLYTEVYRYDFTCQYNSSDPGNSDSYTGYFYDSHSYEVDDQIMAFTDENGDPGNYLITAKSQDTVDISLHGQVFVDSYTDQESGNTYLAADGEIFGGTGTENLGSESGHIIMAGIPEYYFGAETPGGSIFEADLAFYAYDFTCTYGNGDYYSGTVYAAPEFGYDTQYTQTTPDENGQTATYAISNVTSGHDASLAGQVVVNTYYDAESNTTPALATANPVGAAYLGSEDAFILTSGVEEYRFGGPNADGLWLEADLALYAYAFTCTYGNGDYYSGTVYAAPDYGYTAGYTENFTAENNLPGTYAITGMASSNGGVEGQVFVDSYYDSERPYTYTPVHAGSAIGDSYLGTERDYIIFNGMILNRFGIGPEGAEDVHYEADVTYVQYRVNRSRWFKSFRLKMLYYTYLLHPAYDFDNDV